MRPIHQIPTTLVTGFLGAGKTTLINALITHKSHQRWALLLNEFGQIGIDSALVTDDDIAIKEVNGGCICCTGQLPLQVALVRLINEHHPDRLIIEPTGLAHPNELLDQLSEPHWQTTLTLNAVISAHLSGNKKNIALMMAILPMCVTLILLPSIAMIHSQIMNGRL